MLFQSIIASASLMGLAFAANHDIMVGESGLTFSPNTTTAAQGDTVTFHFYPQKHSVVQAAFASPCEPLASGFFSGFVPSTSGMATTTFEITVNDTKPIWFYCSQGKHCQSGMVGAINAATTGNTIEKFKAAAATASNNTTPTVENGTGGTLSAMNMSASGTMTMSMSSTATGAAASATGTGAASALEVGKGLGFSAAFAFLGYLFV